MSRIPRSTALLLALLAAGLLAPSAVPAQRREQDKVLRGVQDGRVMSLREIEQRIVPKMPGCDYLGPEYDDATASYRLKFMRGGSLIWVDVDARTGAVIRRYGQ